MDEWNTTHHGGSGLTQRIKESEITDAEARAIAFINAHVSAKDRLGAGRQLDPPGPPVHQTH